MTAAARWTAAAVAELRSAAWCRREALAHPKASPARARELHEARNRVRESRYCRTVAQLHRVTA